MIEWNDLRVFLAAVRAGSYLVAGKTLAVNRTTVGRRVDALEKAVGVPLFRQTPAGPEPTREGELVLAAAADIEARLERLRTDIGLGEEPVETIRIASSAGIAAEFLPSFAAFQRSEPGASIELVTLPDALEAVSLRRADLALAFVRRPPLRLAGVEIGTATQALYRAKGAPRGGRLGWGAEIEAAIPGQWTSANPAGDERCVARFNSFPQLHEAVRAGLGEAVLWCFAADRDPLLERLAPPDPRHDSALWLLHRAKAPPGPRLARLIAFLARDLPERLARR